jgi:hypothetical protein
MDVRRRKNKTQKSNNKKETTKTEKLFSTVYFWRIIR